MPEKNTENSAMTEENIVLKVTELLETLDHVKRYNALAKSLRKFALIVIGSVVIFLSVGGSLGFANLMAPFDEPLFFMESLLLLIIPITGIIVGVLFIRKRVNSIKTGLWKNEISQGFPGALKILLEINWDETFDEISSGRVSYALYGLLKAGAYWIITTFSLGLLGSLVAFVALRQEGKFGSPFLGLIALLIVYLILRNDLSRRYKEIRALDKLLWELRWFSIELGRAEFQT
jgi:hypothetical protein